MSPKVVVVGAGVIGLSCAVRILQQFPNLDITLMAKDFSPNTTADGAAGIVLPYLPLEVPQTVITEWIRESVSHYNSIFWSSDVMNAGIGLLSVYEIFETESFEPIFYSDALIDCRLLSSKELSMFPSKYKSGVFMTTFFVECKKYLPFLQNQFSLMGGKIIKKHVKSLTELAGFYDVVINCSGLEAKNLVNDEKLVPIRGQLLRVRASWVKHAILAGGLYLIPNTDLVVVGSTRAVGDWNRDEDPDDTKKILEMAYEIMPGIRSAQVENVWVGLRPYRASPRIERELIQIGENQLEVIHNYGHGGCGITLSWGTAKHVIQLLQQILRD